MAFIIDTGGEGGSQGPWFAWSSDGSDEKGFPPKSWVLRGEKNADGTKIPETNIPAFDTGCVMDLDTLKLGWEKDVMGGGAPERRWNPSISARTPRPDESLKGSGARAWTQALSVRCAIGGGKAATWEQGSFGAYEGFKMLAKQIEAQHPGDSTLPLIKQIGVEKRKFAKSNGSCNIPILEIVKWVPRPECLKDVPVIATEPAPVATAKAAPRPDTTTRTYSAEEIAKAAMADVDTGEF